MAHDVPIQSAEQLEMARRAGRLAAEVLGMIAPMSCRV
jgi:methionyl aminopeptidase